MYDPSIVTRVEFELTESCNLACKFCYNSQQTIICSNPLEVIDRIFEAKVLEVILTGGEPTLHPLFFDVLKYACEKIPRVMIQSNGTTFSQTENLKKLSDFPIFCINFSLHGSRMYHDELTNYKGSFDLTTKAIANVLSMGFRVVCNMVLTTCNSNEINIHELVNILSSLGIKEMTLTRFIPCGVGSKSPNLVLNKNEFIQALDLLASETSKKDITLLLANSTPACLIPSKFHKFCSRCSFGFDKFYIDSYGNLMTCGMARIILGNIIENSISEILNKSEIRYKYLTFKHIPSKCRECMHFTMCGGGCRAAALAYENTFDGEDPLSFNEGDQKNE